ncbi:MAG: sigma-70 family RNA polymerase sigma factor, partial [Bacteroidaceae bacterium]|nr:sigma-70 family RNA polymerase sigma factor [Bacteroidaceae bacterium]
MSDQEIIEALIARDERMTELFFFKHCRQLFLSIIRYVFSYEVDYDEFVNEFYLYLMENDAYRLKQYEGRSTMYQWIKVIA